VFPNDEVVGFLVIGELNENLVQTWQQLIPTKDDRGVIFIHLTTQEGRLVLEGYEVIGESFSRIAIKIVSDDEEKICLNSIQDSNVGPVTPELGLALDKTSTDIHSLIIALEKIIQCMRSPDFETMARKSEFLREASFIIHQLKQGNHRTNVHTNLDALLEATGVGRLCQMAINVSSALGSKS